jgi:hypothetical protein
LGGIVMMHKIIAIKQKQINYGKQFILFKLIFFLTIIYNLFFKSVENYNYYILLKQVIILSFLTSLFMLFYLNWLKNKLVNVLKNGRRIFYNYILYVFNFIAFITIIEALGIYIKTPQAHIIYSLILNIVIIYFIFNFVLKSLIHMFFVYFKNYKFNNKKLFKTTNYFSIFLILSIFIIENNILIISKIIISITSILALLASVFAMIIFLYNFFYKQYIIVSAWSLFISNILFSLYLTKTFFSYNLDKYLRACFSHHILYILSSLIIFCVLYVLTKFKVIDNEIEI